MDIPETFDPAAIDALSRPAFSFRRAASDPALGSVSAIATAFLPATTSANHSFVLAERP